MTPSPAFQYDLFLSYADEDEKWVNGYLLPALGLPEKRRISRREFQPGAAELKEFERAIASSRYTLLVLSTAYLRGEWSNYAELLSSHASAKSGQDRVIPMMIETCELPLRVDFRVRLDCRNPEDRDREIGRLRELLSLQEPQPQQIECPYPGMAPFQKKDANAFYGREKEIGELITQVGLQRFLLVVGPSGSGKSSLVFAGLVPRLEKQDPDRWLIKTMRPGPKPAAQLESTLRGRNWSERVQTLLAGSGRKRLLLIVDQLEEIFSQAGKPEQAEFLAAIAGLRQAVDCVVLMTLRADFYHDLLSSAFGDIDESEQINVRPLRGASLREAIVRPAEQMQVYLEDKLVDRLLVDAGEEPGVLPMLQETMRYLWDRRERNLLTLSAYDALDPPLPGITAALALRGKAALSGLSEPQRLFARRILLRLVQFGEGRAHTRRQQSLEALQSEGDNAVDFQAALDALVGHRILTLTSDVNDPGKVCVDLSHERLIEGWPMLRDCVQKRGEAELTRRRLAAKADDWARLGKGWGGLFDSTELAEAEAWLASADAAELGVDARLTALVQKSRRLRLLRRLAVAGVAAVCLLLVWVFRQERIARLTSRIIRSGGTSLGTGQGLEDILRVASRNRQPANSGGSARGRPSLGGRRADALPRGSERSSVQPRRQIRRGRGGERKRQSPGPGEERTRGIRAGYTGGAGAAGCRF